VLLPDLPSVGAKDRLEEFFPVEDQQYRNVRLKRVYERAKHPDGYRILIDRLCLRGPSRERAASDATRRPRDTLRCILIHDQADRDAIDSHLLRYRDGHGDDWADIIECPDPQLGAHGTRFCAKAGIYTIGRSKLMSFGSGSISPRVAYPDAFGIGDIRTWRQGITGARRRDIRTHGAMGISRVSPCREES
jgi:hypothetical protein